ncbi:uncharacterized protein C6orf132 homolog [Orycteropus afer afer]|uniref:Uncharacterized protein C6orf132 homolog n=1 Tax=Orycteropus afer afer TaxID=1230840 RepID=A0A8B6ZHC9_ORYAF|nr:uncharacterized protein C6orf132 homolog [Orycteropus afer afer]
MKKNQTVQGTFSKLFGKKHGSPTTTSLYATNPPWIFTQEAPEQGTRDFDGIYYGENRFDTVSESGTATLKARPRVRPLLTFLPLNAQENQGLAVPTPSVPEDFADKDVTALPPAAPPLPSAEKATPPLAKLAKSSKSSSPPKPKLPSPEDTASSAPIDWRDPSQMEKLRNELAAYLCGSRREDRLLNHRPDPAVASQDKKGPSLPAKEAPLSLPGKEVSPSVPEKSPHNSSSLPEKRATTNLTLPPVDYIAQDSQTPSVQQIRAELEARLSSSSEKEAKPNLRSMVPKPLPERNRIFENGAGNGKFSKPMAKNLPPVSVKPLPTRQLQPTCGPATPPKVTPGPATPPKVTPGPATPPKATPGSATPPKATPGPATPPKATPGPSIDITLHATSSQQMAEKDLVPPGQGEKPVESQDLGVPSQPETKRPTSEASKLPTQGVSSSPAYPPKTSSVQDEALYLYKPHCSQNSPSREVAVVMPNLARGEITGSGEPIEVKKPQGLLAKPPVSAPPADELLRHPVTGEVVEQGSPMALLLAARQRAQKGRLGGAALGRGRLSLPGSLRGHSSPPGTGSDSRLYKEGQVNSFTVVPKLSKETTKDPQLVLSTQPTVLSQWKPQPCKDPDGKEPSCWHKWTKAEPQASMAREKSAPFNHPQGCPLPKSFSSPSSPSHKREEEFSFEVIPPPPEFSNDPDPPAPTLQYPRHPGSSPRNNFSDLGQPRDVSSAASVARGFSHFPPGALSAEAGGLDRFSAGGRSLIKKRLYVGEHHRSPGVPHGGTGRSLSSPNCFGPQPGGPFGASGGPEKRRVNSVSRAPPSGLPGRRTSLESTRGAHYAGNSGETKYKAPSGDYGFAPAASRSTHRAPQYSSPVNTFTVRPGTRQPISFAYPGGHRKATS